MKKHISSKTLKNIFMGMGAVSAIVAPVAAVISCGESSSSSSTTTPTTNPTTPSSSIKIDASGSYDVSKVSSTSEFVDSVAAFYGLNMPEKATNLTPSASDAGMAKIKAYLTGVKTATQPKITLTNGTSTYALDFSGVSQYAKQLLDFVNSATRDKDFTDNGKYTTDIGTKAVNIQGLSYTKIILSWQTNLKMAGYLSMFDPSIIKMKDNGQGGQEVDIDDLIQNHPYLNVLRAYHNVFKAFVASDFYKAWISGKTFAVLKNDPNGLSQYGYSSDGTAVTANAGELYDQSDSLAYAKVNNQPYYEIETSNLEFLFIYHVLHLNS